jgi:DNA-directed RNA polymerase subunit RPC12/RpoP
MTTGMPSVEMRVCIACGMPGCWKYDKKGRPYFSCPYCMIRIFPHGLGAIVGIELLHQMVISNLSAFRLRARNGLMQRMTYPGAPIPSPRRIPPPPGLKPQQAARDQ